MAIAAGKRTKDEWVGTLKQSVYAMAWTVGSSALFALAVDREWMAFDKVGYGAMGILLSAGFICGRGGGRSGDFIKAGLSAAGYVAMLLVINLLLFGGEFESVLLSVCLIALGALLRLGVNKGTDGRKRKRGYKIPKR